MNYDTHVRPFSGNFNRIKISSVEKNKVSEWVHEVIAQKLSENHWMVDNGSAIKRWTTGVMGELALEKLLGEQFIDWSIGDSKSYHQADLRSIGLNIGIKTVRHGDFPVIFIQNNYPQIINIYRETDETVFVCGLATKSILNTYQSMSLIRSDALRARGTKTGFHGFQYLLPFQSREDLSNHLQNC